MKKKILIVVGTRPNFIKITQFDRVFAQYPEEFEFRLLHTGQHYDARMSEIFFEQLKLREPDYYLGIGAGSPAAQMGQIMAALSAVLDEWQPDLVMVPGDVNSTLAAALTANKHHIRLAHLESGLRSRDRSMPEEINRILTDEITDLCFVTEQSGLDHLAAEGKASSQVHFVGNTMIDTLVAFDDAIQASPILEQLGVEAGKFVLMTMHRPANVDFKPELEKLIALLRFITQRYDLVLPLHPRTAKRLQDFGLWEEVQAIDRLILGEPMDYLAFQKLIASCAFVLTDSGGIQEETTFRQVPCITLRPNTERPSTLTLGTNELADFDLAELEQKIERIVAGTYKNGQVPPLWDGKATERIVEVLRERLI
jgi:UDP-N-acetylglucosamine 2-epimerase (non-hydrolysing)